MKFTKRTMLLLAVATAAFLALAISAGAADNDPVTVNGILKAAGCPLTADQAKKLADYTPPQRGQGGQGGQGGGQAAGQGGQRGGGMGSALNDIFDAKQTAALIAKLGETPARGDRPARARLLSQVVALEKAKCPLTEKQVADLKGLEMGQDYFQQMQDILTEAQRAAMPMGRGMGGGGMGGGRGN